MIRLVLAILLILSFNSSINAQQYLIIDRKLKQPLQFANTITDEQLNKGFFAIEKNNIEPLLLKLDSLRKRLREVARETYDQTSWDIGATRLTVKVIKFPVADRLNVALSTDIGNGHNKEFYIVDGKLTNNDNARYLARLIKYIKQ
jgi:hypothetical protein